MEEMAEDIDADKGDNMTILGYFMIYWILGFLWALKDMTTKEYLDKLMKETEKQGIYYVPQVALGITIIIMASITAFFWPLKALFYIICFIFGKDPKVVREQVEKKAENRKKVDRETQEMVQEFRGKMNEVLDKWNKEHPDFQMMDANKKDQDDQDQKH